MAGVTKTVTCEHRWVMRAVSGGPILYHDGPQSCKAAKFWWRITFDYPGKGPVPPAVVDLRRLATAMGKPR